MDDNSASGLIHTDGIDAETLDLVMKEFENAELQNQIKAEMERRAIARANAQPVYWRDDFRVKMRISPLMLNSWIRREGPDVWDDSFHEKYFRKHFPECFPKQISPKIQVGYSGEGKRERINYGEI